MRRRKIGLIAGSLRRESYSKKLAKNILTLAPDDFEFVMVDISDLPVFNQDFDDDGQVPESYRKLRETITSLDGFIFITPEHNRSVPSVLKNALDIASRPYGQNKWGGKPGAIMSNSPGNLSGFGANHHLRQILSFLDVWVMQQPEAYIANVNQILDKEGRIHNEDSLGFIQKFIDSFTHWFKRLEK